MLIPLLPSSYTIPLLYWSWGYRIKRSVIVLTMPIIFLLLRAILIFYLREVVLKSKLVILESI